jgi:protein NUD1
VTDVVGLSTLIHLRELRVDNNLLTSLDGILKLDGLLRVSAKHNQISLLDFTESRLLRLEVLEGQQNCIGWVEGLDELLSLMSLHLGFPPYETGPVLTAGR